LGKDSWVQDIAPDVCFAASGEECFNQSSYALVGIGNWKLEILNEMRYEIYIEILKYEIIRLSTVLSFIYRSSSVFFWVLSILNNNLLYTLYSIHRRLLLSKTCRQHCSKLTTTTTNGLIFCSLRVPKTIQNKTKQNTHREGKGKTHVIPETTGTVEGSASRNIQRKGGAIDGNQKKEHKQGGGGGGKGKWNEVDDGSMP